MHFARHLRTEQLGMFAVGTDEAHRSESLAITQVLILYHLVMAKATAAIGGDDVANGRDSTSSSVPSRGVAAPLLNENDSLLASGGCSPAGRSRPRRRSRLTGVAARRLRVGQGAARADARTAVATTTQVADLARAVAGERAEVRQILRPNSDPHAYEPRPSDVKAVAGAGVVLRSGGGLDDWLGDVVDNAGSDAATTTLIDAVRPRRGEGGVDPHWWQDPRNAIAAVRPHPRRDDRRRSGRARRRTRRTPPPTSRSCARSTRAIAACMRAIPAARRRLVTDHDALGYYADRYAHRDRRHGDPGAVDAGAGLRRARSRASCARSARPGVRTIFPEGSASAKLARAVARDAGRDRSARRCTPTRSARPAARARRTSARCASTRARSPPASAARASPACQL